MKTKTWKQKLAEQEEGIDSCIFELSKRNGFVSPYNSIGCWKIEIVEGAGRNSGKSAVSFSSVNSPGFDCQPLVVEGKNLKIVSKLTTQSAPTILPASTNYRIEIDYAEVRVFENNSNCLLLTIEGDD